MPGRAGNHDLHDICRGAVIDASRAGNGRTPDGVLSMPPFGNAYSDNEIAAVANYVTTRFGVQSNVTAKEVAELRSQMSR